MSSFPRSTKPTRKTSHRRTASRRLVLEVLEGRALLATFTPIGFQGPFTNRLQTLQPQMSTIPEGNVTFGGVPFITRAGGNNAWIGAGPSTISINVGVAGVSEVHTLMNTIYGAVGTHAALEFFGSDGAYYRKDLVNNSDIRDHFNALWTNSINNTTTTNVFSNGPARLDKQEIILPPEFLSQTLQSIRVIDDGNNNYSGTPISTWQNVIFYGVTVGVDASDIVMQSAQLMGFDSRIRQWEC